MKLKVTIINKEELASLLTADIEKYMDHFVKVGIRIAGPQILQFTEEAINQFYGAYHSIYYWDRTGNLQNNSFSPICETVGASTLVGVEISSANMSGYESGISPDKIVGYTWFKGAHGYPGYPGTHFSYPPLSMLEMAVGSIALQTQREAMQSARSQKYNVLRF